MSKTTLFLCVCVCYSFAVDCLIADFYYLKLYEAGLQFLLIESVTEFIIFKHKQKIVVSHILYLVLI